MLHNCEYASFRIENPTHEADKMVFFTAHAALAYAHELIELGFCPRAFIYNAHGWEEITLESLSEKA